MYTLDPVCIIFDPSLNLFKTSSLLSWVLFFSVHHSTTENEQFTDMNKNVTNDKNFHMSGHMCLLWMATCQDTSLFFSMLHVLNQDGEEVEQMTSTVQFSSLNEEN